MGAEGDLSSQGLRYPLLVITESMAYNCHERFATESATKNAEATGWYRSNVHTNPRLPCSARASIPLQPTCANGRPLRSFPLDSTLASSPPDRDQGLPEAV